MGSDVADRWEATPARGRASLLRRIALQDEADFIDEVRTSLRDGVSLSDEQEWRILELFKDMAEEFIATNKTELAADAGTAVPFLSFGLPGIYERVQKVVRETPFEKARDFVLKHAHEYMATTGREGNWAGSSEMAALARALRRPFAAYGNNFVAEDDVEVKEVEAGKLEVQPYFLAPAPAGERSLPVRVFQTKGGGHYQMLI